ncbi:unnamed protein product [Arctia plantaginis]|uniref:Homologous recombination OB-fold protein OB-fold domain-containing protein n=1 Tax=Arctia plantaginis TaxID=874455 RepID=A0A8S1AX60_ARCPL|nr:unnamed protein product [Arctia plantaginis]CAB3253326.1 unnamed protein product [Arctia plantaginis]
MFESDDFDQVLSQFKFPEDCTDSKSEGDTPRPAISEQFKDVAYVNTENRGNESTRNQSNEEIQSNSLQNEKKTAKEMESPRHMKRNMINSYFDHKSKRKFPGPAGLLTGDLQGNRDEPICQMELLSQDVNFSQTNLRGDLFESPLWTRLLDDLKHWNLKNVDSIKTIKEQAITGSLRRRKAHTITAFVEAIDRSVSDPFIMMRDTTGNIKGTLHRDAWSAFSQYIASEFCAFILWKPTILTTGAAFKKHYLNITLSNILAVYSSTVLNNEAENKPLPDGYSIVYEDDYTVIKTQNSVQNIGTNSRLNSVLDNESNDLLDGLENIFSDDIF